MSPIFCLVSLPILFLIFQPKLQNKESDFKSKYFDKLFVKGKIDVDAVISPDEVAKAIIRQLKIRQDFLIHFI